MSDLAIRAEGLGKRYQLRHQQERYLALRDVIANASRSGVRKALSIFRRPRTASMASGTVEDFWAIRDVSFEMNHGEVVGIIGRNGAGKSTLLKILSRITEPSEGRVRLRGRVASLLEVGTGFHPELTGRENIQLNGAVLGMRRAEIARRFDEIVAFAEVERFLDTPVKRYSSGMYVRLAFAVAAHLEPEVLIIDEVLSVGDLAFQMKCLGKMKDVSAAGRTVLYVSHNLASVTSLCTRGILLDRGRIAEDTTAERAVNSYLHLGLERQAGEPHVLFQGTPNGADYQVLKVEMLDEDGEPKSMLKPMDFVRLRVTFRSSARIPQGSIVLELLSMHGTVVLKLETNPAKVQPLADEGQQWVDCCIMSLPLLEGQYVLGVGLAIYGVRFLTWLPDAAHLVVSEPGFGSGAEMSVDRKGLIVVNHEWETPARVTC